jgi:hypothetical protein
VAAVACFAVEVKRVRTRKYTICRCEHFLISAIGRLDIIAGIGRRVARESTLAGQMSTAAWALSGPGRQVRKPAAFQVRIVDRGVVETVEIVRTVNEGHDIAGCVREVCESPRATTNLLTPLSDLVRSRTALMDGKWAPVVRSIVDLNRAIQEAAKHNIVRRRR